MLMLYVCFTTQTFSKLNQLGFASVVELRIIFYVGGDFFSFVITKIIFIKF